MKVSKLLLNTKMDFTNIMLSKSLRNVFCNTKTCTVGDGLKAVCQHTIPQSRKALHSHLYSSVI